MKTILIISSIFIFVFLIEYAAAKQNYEFNGTQNGHKESNEVTASETEVDDVKIDKDSNENIFFAYENYTPADRNEYTYQGLNIDYQITTSAMAKEVEMTMGPNVSFLTGEYKNNEEDIALLKWNQGLLYNYDVGVNMLLQPQAQIGLGYGWIDSIEDQQSPIFEFLAGVNLKPNNNLNFYAKVGYRYFELNNVGERSLGDLKGGLAMLGMGVGI